MSSPALLASTDFVAPAVPGRSSASRSETPGHKPQPGRGLRGRVEPIRAGQRPGTEHVPGLSCSHKTVISSVICDLRRRLRVTQAVPFGPASCHQLVRSEIRPCGARVRIAPAWRPLMRRPFVFITFVLCALTGFPAVPVRAAAADPLGRLASPGDARRADSRHRPGAGRDYASALRGRLRGVLRRELKGAVALEVSRTSSRRWRAIRRSRISRRTPGRAPTWRSPTR